MDLAGLRQEAAALKLTNMHTTEHISNVASQIADDLSMKYVAEITRLQASHRRHLSFLVNRLLPHESDAEVISAMSSFLQDSVSHSEGFNEGCT